MRCSQMPTGVNERPSAEFRDRFGETVQAFARAVRSDQVIVAHPGQDAAADIGWMHDNIHILFDVHRLVLADEWTLHEIVALAVAVQPLLFRPPVLAAEGPSSTPAGIDEMLSNAAATSRMCDRIRGVFGARLCARLG